MTPIDWKLGLHGGRQDFFPVGRHSLVTPIDWKQHCRQFGHVFSTFCRHSLVTPIDWKPLKIGLDELNFGVSSPFFGDAY